MRIPFHISWLVLFALPLKGQKPHQVERYPDGSSSYLYYTAKDTFLVNTYPKGKKESSRRLKNNRANGPYLRWYENGQLMWRKNMKDDVEEGKAEYFNAMGKKVAELLYCRGSVCDTLYLAPKQHLVLGKISYTSRVVGGAVREDGQANVSEHSGVYARCALYVVKTEEKKKPVLLSKIRSDAYGQFFVLVPEAKLGFYPQNMKLDALPQGHYMPPEQMWNSGNDTWSVNGPLEVRPEDLLLFIELQRVSVGYAP